MSTVRWFTAFRTRRDDSTSPRGGGRPFFALPLILAAALWCPGCGGDEPVVPPVVRHVFHATPDGAGSDCGSLQTCIDAAAAGDTIELAAGVYATVSDTLFPGGLDGAPVTAIMVARRSVVIRAASGAAAIVDGGDDRHRVGLCVPEGAGSVAVIGIRFRAGGAGIRATGGELRLRDCHFGGGAWRGLVADGVVLDVTGCRFAEVAYEGVLLRDCSGILARSSLDSAGTGLFTAGSGGLHVESTLITGAGAAIRVEEGGTAVLSGLTVWGSGAGAGDSSAIVVAGGAAATLNRCIVGGSRGFGLHCRAGGTATVSCSDFHQNLAGNYAGMADPTGLSGNLAVDPAFCDLAEGDFHLAAGSPARLAACGAMGAFAAEPCGAGNQAPALADSRGARLP